LGSVSGVEGRRSGQGCEMPICSKLIIKLMNHKKSLISGNGILVRVRHASSKAWGLSGFIMQIIYLVYFLSDF
jgi:hypothetical protein